LLVAFDRFQVLRLRSEGVSAHHQRRDAIYAGVPLKRHAAAFVPNSIGPIIGRS
jgi:hypothetical protein